MVFALALALQTSVATDARLAKHADFDVSLRQITEFCQEVSQTSGVPLKVDTKVADLKVDVFVDGKPLNETLDKVAKALNCEWIPFEKGYRLERDVPTMNRERNFNTAEDEEDLRLLKLTLWAREYVARRIPGTNTRMRPGQSRLTIEEQRAITEPFEKEYKDASNAKDAIRTRAALETWSAISSSIGDIAIGRVLMQLDKQALDRFWKGEPFAASAFPDSQYKIFPSDVLSFGTTSFAGADGKTVEADTQYCTFLRFDPVQGKMRMNLLTYTFMPPNYGGGIGISKSGGGFSYSSTSHEISDALKKMPFFEDLKPWMDADSTPTKFPQAIDTKTKEWDSPWHGSRRRMGEHLRWLHQATHIPIIAQADRSCLWNWVKLNRGFRTTAEYLKAMMNDFGVYVKEDQGFLLARNFRYWTNRRHETPEATWEKLEPKEPKKHLTFDDHLAIASTLRQDQIHTTDLGYPLCRANLFTVKVGYDSLRLAGMLSKAQLDASMKEGGLAQSELNANQQQQFQSTLIKLVMDSGVCSYDLARKLVSGGMSADLLSSLRLRTKLTTFDNFNEYIDEVKDGNDVIVRRGTENSSVTQVTFSYEAGPKETLEQTIQLKK